MLAGNHPMRFERGPLRPERARRASRVLRFVFDGRSETGLEGLVCATI